jgi:hypothetical protein
MRCALTDIQQMIQDDILSAKLRPATNVTGMPRIFKLEKEIATKRNRLTNPRRLQSHPHSRRPEEFLKTMQILSLKSVMSSRQLIVLVVVRRNR